MYSFSFIINFEMVTDLFLRETLRQGYLYRLFCLSYMYQDFSPKRGKCGVHHVFSEKFVFDSYDKVHYCWLDGAFRI